MKHYLHQAGIFVLTYLNYMSVHMLRSIWSSATKDLEKLYGFTTDTVADLNIVNLSFYAASAVLLGRVADNPSIKISSYVSLLMLLLGLETITYGLFMGLQTQHKAYYFALKAVDGIITAPIFPSHLVILSNWFPKKGRGLLVGCWLMCT